jgi:hypothetical protein
MLTFVRIPLQISLFDNERILNMKIIEINKMNFGSVLRSVSIASTISVLACGSFPAAASVTVKHGARTVCATGSETWSASTTCNPETGAKGLASVTVGGVSLYPIAPSTGGDMSASGTATAPSGGWTPGAVFINASDNCGARGYATFIALSAATVGGNTATFYDAPKGPINSSITFTLNAVCMDTGTPVTLASINWSWAGPTTLPAGQGIAYGTATAVSANGITVTYISGQVGINASYTSPCTTGCQNINWVQYINTCVPTVPAAPRATFQWPWNNATLPTPDLGNNPGGNPPTYYPPADPPTAKCGC